MPQADINRMFLKFISFFFFTWLYLLLYSPSTGRIMVNGYSAVETLHTTCYLPVLQQGYITGVSKGISQGYAWHCFLNSPFAFATVPPGPEINTLLQWLLITKLFTWSPWHTIFMCALHTHHTLRHKGKHFSLFQLTLSHIYPKIAFSGAHSIKMQNKVQNKVQFSGTRKQIYSNNYEIILATRFNGKKKKITG